MYELFPSQGRRLLIPWSGSQRRSWSGISSSTTGEISMSYHRFGY